jgi:hypothetical protein
MWGWGWGIGCEYRDGPGDRERVWVFSLNSAVEGCEKESTRKYTQCVYLTRRLVGGGLRWRTLRMAITQRNCTALAGGDVEVMEVKSKLDSQVSVCSEHTDSTTNVPTPEPNRV